MKSIKMRPEKNGRHFFDFNLSVNTTVVAVYLHCGVQQEALTLFFYPKPQCQDISSKIYYPNPDIRIIVIIVFLQYRNIGDSLIMIPQCNDIILLVPWYIIMLGFHCNLLLIMVADIILQRFIFYDHACYF